MEFINLKKQYQLMQEEIDFSIRKILRNCNFIMGAEVMELESKLSDYTGVKHVITCDNGTNALVMAMKALGIGSSCGVIVPALTFVASAEAVSIAGAQPVFCDVDRDTFNICPKALEQTIEKTKNKINLKAIVAVDLYGLPINYEAIKKIAKKHNLFIIEDAAQGFGGKINDKKACSFGDIAATSFFPSKPLGCYGDGGAIFTDEHSTAEYLKSIRHHGMGSDKYDNVRIGYNSRLDTLQAAILIVKLKYLEDEIQRKQQIANKYSLNLKDVVKVPAIPEGYVSSWAQYTIVLPERVNRSALISALRSKGIPTMVYYPKPLHLQKAYEPLMYKNGDFPIAENLSRTILSLPISGYVTNEEVEYVSNSIKEYMHKT